MLQRISTFILQHAHGVPVVYYILDDVTPFCRTKHALWRHVLRAALIDAFSLVARFIR